MRPRLRHNRFEPTFFPDVVEESILAPLKKSFPPLGIVLWSERTAQYFVALKETGAATLQLVRDSIREFGV
jgi:hypothetical protein